MRKLISLLVALLICTLNVFAGDKDKAVFTEKSYDFGMIKEEKGSVTHEFVFTNTGDKPLVVISATASCGCTRPDFPKDPVKPGKTGKIKVTYNPSGRPGEFDKTVKVRYSCGDSKSSRVSLKITGTVVPKGE